MKNTAVSIFWFRRDLRLEDNVGLFHALNESRNIFPIFIFDSNILNKIKNPNDRRVLFLHKRLAELKKQIQEHGSDLHTYSGKPLEVFKQLYNKFKIETVYTNNDYEPYATWRDLEVSDFLKSKGTQFKSYKDQSLFEKEEILKKDGTPYTVFTAYKNKVLKELATTPTTEFPSEKLLKNLSQVIKKSALISLKDLGFNKVEFSFPSENIDLNIVKHYHETRNFPHLENGTSHLGIHLRFGTVSVRKLAKIAQKYSDVWLSELIWRDFFKQILWHHPRVVSESFRPQYDDIAWRNSKSDLNKWITGTTGYPIVDAGMRELAATGHMHNRVRMIVASFLTKHLLIHWSEGEKYFASQLLDYDLSSNNGNWQWAAGSGCDAAPYFRIFNPEIQTRKFDPDFLYIKKWIPEFGTAQYAKPMVSHNFARQRCLLAYNKVLKSKKG